MPIGQSPGGASLTHGVVKDSAPREWCSVIMTSFVIPPCWIFRVPVRLTDDVLDADTEPVCYLIQTRRLSRYTNPELTDLRRRTCTGVKRSRNDRTDLDPVVSPPETCRQARVLDRISCVRQLFCSSAHVPVCHYVVKFSPSQGEIAPDRWVLVQWPVRDYRRRVEAAFHRLGIETVVDEEYPEII